MDTIWGNYRQFFSDGLAFTYDLKELANLWQASNTLNHHWQQSGMNLFVLDYEVLIEKPEETIKNLLDFVNLKWQDACLNFHTNKRAVRTTSALQVRQPLSNSRVNRWKRYEKHLAEVHDIINQA